MSSYNEINISSNGKTVDGPQKLPYKAYGGGKSTHHRLQLRPKDSAWERLSYSILFRMLEGKLDGKIIVLMYYHSVAVVTIQGRNLQPIADAIGRNSCDFIQEFDPERWDYPADHNAPFIESITINRDPPDILSHCPSEKVIDLVAKASQLTN